MNNIIALCKELLYNNYDAKSSLEYLDSRLSRDVQNKFEFGYFPNSDNLSLISSVISKELLIDKQLISILNIESSHGKIIKTNSFFNYHPLVMPYKDVYGKTIAMVGRSLLSEDKRRELKIPKYKNTVFKKSNNLFGLNEAKEEILNKDFVYVVEGQFDVIKSHENNIYNIVALGNSSMSAYQFGLLLRYTNNIKLLLDNDDAGISGRNKIISLFGRFANIENVYLPQGYKDIDEYFAGGNLYLES